MSFVHNLSQWVSSLLGKTEAGARSQLSYLTVKVKNTALYFIVPSGSAELRFIALQPIIAIRVWGAVIPCFKQSNEYKDDKRVYGQ